MKKSLLLHCCCGPCSSASIERLKFEGHTPLLYFDNSNIFPHSEYLKRLKEAEKVAGYFGLEIKTGEYDHDAWLLAVKGYENEPEGGERCRRCFQFNLGRSSLAAQQEGLESFTTTLTISPWKNSELIFSVGREFSGFQEWNFKKKEGYKRSIELSKELYLYRQNWCGCEFSHRDSSSSP